jgi:DNA polymerase-1
MEKEREDFPFSYKLKPVPEDNAEAIEKVSKKKEDLHIEILKGEDLVKEIKNGIIKIFEFYKYLDPYSEDYINKEGNKGPTYLVKVDYYVIKKEMKPGRKTPIKHKTLLKTWYIYVTDFKSDYKYVLIKSLDQLKESLKDMKEIAFDTETTGLNPEEDKLVSLSYSNGNKTGYYLPVAHSKKYAEFNLGYDAVDIFYEAMTKAKVVYMFNARFDMRVMEYCERHYDMSKVKVMDVQINAWYADPDFRDTRLKYFEKHFLGYYRLDLSDTMKASKINNFNTSLIHPHKLLFYAAQDALSTFDLAKVTYKFYKEFGLSGQIDQALLYPLMKMENHAIRIDMDLLEKELNVINPRLKELDDLIKDSVGDINLNSPTQKIELFKSFGLDTGVKTKTGNMSTGTKEVEAMIDKLDAKGKEYPDFLKYLGERSKLNRLSTGFFGSLLEQAKMNDGRIRINYRNTVASTGRLSSGEEKE